MESLIDIEDFPGRLLHQAALWDNAELMEDLLNGEEISCLNSRDSWGRTPLHAAAMTEGSRCLRILIQSGASLDEICGPRGESRTPLHIASEHGHVSNVILLLESGGVTLNLKDAHGLTALDLAEKGEHVEVMRALKEAAEAQEDDQLRNYEAHLFHPGTMSGGSGGSLWVPPGCRGALYLAAEAGQESLLSAILIKGSAAATEDIHPVTKYSPLYIASKNGHSKCVRHLLKALPMAIHTLSIEGRSPLHAGALSGNPEVLTALLTHEYPVEVLREQQRVLPDGRACYYSFPLDLNSRDSQGESPLFLALRIGSLECLRVFLSFKPHGCHGSSPLSLHGPPLVAAVGTGDPRLVQELLSAGCNPNGSLNEQLSTQKKEAASSCPSNALLEACKNRDLRIIDILLRAGALDPDSKALAEAQNNEAILSKLLSVRSSLDPEGKGPENSSASSESLASAALFQVWKPVKIDWSSSGGVLEVIKDSWLTEASLRVNPGLKLSPSYPTLALEAITFLDLSRNELRFAPSCLFTSLSNVRYVNLAMNKLESLGAPDEVEESSEEEDSPPLALTSLEELHLQNNRLESLPGSIFTLPTLNYLDASNNKLSSLPPEIWSCPRLTDLNLSFNLLSDLQIQLSCPPEDFLQGGEAFEEESHLDPDQSILEGGENASLASSGVSIPEHLLPCEFVRHSLWSSSLHILPEVPPGKKSPSKDTEPGGEDTLKSLNLAHNSFSVLPKVLSCFSPGLTRLNLSYNALASLSGGYGSLPTGLKYLDLSHNTLNALPECSPSAQNTFCYRSYLQGRMLRCSHRSHGALDSLRSLNLSHNNLGILRPDIKATPSLNHLDVSRNELKEVCSSISGLSQLSVLNLGDNPSLHVLPPSLGLCGKLWNLNTGGCSLGEPLASLIASPSCKSSGVVSYLRSVLQDARPYARMKLMVVGEAGIGKTSLLELLRTEGVSGAPRSRLHWTKRMGHKGGSLGLSTVGVDIGDWTYEPKGGGIHGGGPISFRTWDFGGQSEYYATHQYFLSRRSLYLVLWKLSDGESGLNGLSQWLINIQSRAPNSPVLLVGTHYDLVARDFPMGYIEHLQETIRTRFINVSDPEKRGLPAVLDSLEVSCRSRHNVRLLANRIHEVCSSLRVPGTRNRLLDVKVPASYLALEEIVANLAGELRGSGRDPVLPLEAFEDAIREQKPSFGEGGQELSAAIKFLHENGVLLHYEDATLRDLIFLDPQWLCDLLSHVVTIREINPFAGNGLMRLEDLRLLFKSSAALSINAKSYVVNLLNKFEIGLTLDSNSLLIPSNLPTEEAMRSGRKLRVAVPLRTRGLRGRKSESEVLGGSRSQSVPVRTREGFPSIAGSPKSKAMPSQQQPLNLSVRSEKEHSLRRLILLSYFPSGFWGRLLSRILCDESFIGVVRGYFPLPESFGREPGAGRLLAEHKPTWIPWQSGLELRYLETSLLILREVFPKSPYSTYPYHTMTLESLCEGIWTPLEASNSSILELTLPQDTVVLKRPVKDLKETIGYAATVLDPCPKAVSRLLARVTEHVDNLLEDWYPSLGTRFLHTSSGKMLVTRVIPCPRCLLAYDEEKKSTSSSSANGQPSKEQSFKSSSSSIETLLQPEIESPGPPVSSFPVEECILLGFKSENPKCRSHGEVPLGQIAPDLVFLDLEPRIRISPESLNLSSGELLGSGSFGSVYKSVIRSRGSKEDIPVAVKLCSPGLSRESDPLLAAVRSYISARSEISILLTLKHPHILPLLGVCVKPLALVLELAPGGSLEGVLSTYRNASRHLPIEPLCAVLLQISRSLEYLHQHHIIYRDLKSENVLVWSFPSPHNTDEKKKKKTGESVTVCVKLADYGISRTSLPCGTKGFGGTEGFMAPEILRHNGEEEYNEKADIFSFGMFTYELLTLREPFSGSECVKEALLGGLRPPISLRETLYPLNVLDIMTASWESQPKSRPSSSQLVSILSAPEFPRLLDAVSLGPAASSPAQVHCGGEAGIWISSDSVFERQCTLRVLKHGRGKWNGLLRFRENFADSFTALCLVEGSVWAGDNAGNLSGFSLSDYSRSFIYNLDNSPVRVIANLPGSRRAVVGLHNGRLFLLNTGVTPRCPSGAEGVFILSELGSSSCIHSLAVRSGDPDSLWAGCSHGSLSVFAFSPEGVFTAQVVLNHFNPIRENLHVLGLLSGSESVYSSLFPGSTVYQWDPEARIISGRLDVSRLLPVSESFRSLSEQEAAYNPGKCQITALALATGGLLLIGTNLGCLVWADPKALQPLTVCRPFASSVQCLLPLLEGGGFLSLGKGYRPLLPRYVSPTANHEEDEPGSREEDSLFALLWAP